MISRVGMTGSRESFHPITQITHQLTISSFSSSSSFPLFSSGGSFIHPLVRPLKSMRENSERTEFLGINIATIPVDRFCHRRCLCRSGRRHLGSFLSFRGALLICSGSKSGEPVMAAILGGPSLFFGPILGMFIMTFFHAWVLGFTVFWPVVMGALILIIIFFLPGGILGFAQERLKGERKQRKHFSF